MAKLLPVVIDPDPILRKKSEEVDARRIKEPDFQELVSDMALTMQKKDGVGLAAPQIGKNIRMIIVENKDGPMCLINPILSKNSIRKEWGQEGCLSVPNKFGEVRRHKKTTCTYVDQEGKKHTIVAQGLLARIFQHEIDHLDGILFIDKARDIKEIKNFKTGNKEKLD
ncbi:peptide deformylase [Candidatus Parcubacteria bacterium]|nr:peptide deformylase [Candidatus Parcubacteria bacterium]